MVTDECEGRLGCNGAGIKPRPNGILPEEERMVTDPCEGLLGCGGAGIHRPNGLIVPEAKNSNPFLGPVALSVEG